jgi:hypothetical protein
MMMMKLTDPDVVKKFRHLVQTKASLPHSQNKSDQSNPSLLFPHLKDPFLKLSSRLILGLPSGLLPSDLPTKTLYAPLLLPKHATGPTNPIHFDLTT